MRACLSSFFLSLSLGSRDSCLLCKHEQRQSPFSCCCVSHTHLLIQTNRWQNMCAHRSAQTDASPNSRYIPYTDCRQWLYSNANTISRFNFQTVIPIFFSQNTTLALLSSSRVWVVCVSEKGGSRPLVLFLKTASNDNSSSNPVSSSSKRKRSIIHTHNFTFCEQTCHHHHHHLPPPNNWRC